jgi:hypothetical protein
MAMDESEARKELGELFKSAVTDHPDVMAECKCIFLLTADIQVSPSYEYTTSLPQHYSTNMKLSYSPVHRDYEPNYPSYHSIQCENYGRRSSVNSRFRPLLVRLAL